MIVVKILLGILIFSVIVIFHEFGHFILAKKNGIGVTEFAIGMGPKIWGVKKGDTEYVIRCLPLGGSCMMVGEDQDLDAEDAFNKKSVWARMSVIAAGPVFNFILAFVFALIVVGFNGWDHADIQVDKDSPSVKAGLKDGDVIKEINGYKVLCARDIGNFITFKGFTKDTAKIVVDRDGNEETVDVKPEYVVEYQLSDIEFVKSEEEIEFKTVKKDSPFDKAGVAAGDKFVGINGTRVNNATELSQYLTDNDLAEKIDIEYIDKDDDKTKTAEVVLTENTKRYRVGFNFNQSFTERQKVGALATVKYSFIEVEYWIKTTVLSLGKLIRGQVKADELSGPVGIVDFIGDTYDDSMEAGGAKLTTLTMLYISILLSANIGVMNLLPIPALDGGRLVFLIIEAIRRKPLKPEIEGTIHAIGLALLMILMVVILFNDVFKLITG